MRRGYFRDDFVQFFVRTPVPRPVIINRGYYTRHAILRSIILSFLKATVSSSKKQGQVCRQVLSLGAGFDTTFFQLSKDGLIDGETKWVEMDLQEVTQRKTTIIDRTTGLQCAVFGHQGRNLQRDDHDEALRSDSMDSTLDIRKGYISTRRYALLPADLRSVEQVQQALNAAALDGELPTMIVAECVLVYMGISHSNKLLSLLCQYFPRSVCAIYEQVNPNDAFGQQMMLNLNCRGCPLLGILPSLEAQSQRLMQAGWERCSARCMLDLHENSLHPEDRCRIERLEMLDEFEEWNLLQSHYCVALGIKDADEALHNVHFPSYSSDA